MPRNITKIVLCALFFIVSETEISASDLDSRRASMIEVDIKGRGVTDTKVVGAMSQVRREDFVGTAFKGVAYEDRPLPIGHGQTISQPYVVAYMTEALGLKGDETVLEIGTGSGYQASILAEIIPKVYSIEIQSDLASKAKERLKDLGYKNVTVKNADGYDGWTDAAPFDAIMITAAANHIPPPLLAQLKTGGKLILPLGSTRYFQTLTLVTKTPKGPTTKYLIDVRFVPMTGKIEKEE